MRLPTVRVKHPVLGFVTINASDFTEQHELHDEQAADFDPAHLQRSLPVAPLDPALRDAAAALCLRMAALRRRAVGEPFADLPAPEQMAVLQDLGAELDRAEAAYEDDQRERAAFEASDREREAAAPGDQSDDGVPDATAPRAAKGPGGRWYVYRGDERVSKGFATEAEAVAEIQRDYGTRGA